jgi:HPt (histidine-containing phosphotransfer) domain-containing protein
MFPAEMDEGLFGESFPAASHEKKRPSHIAEVDVDLDLPPIDFEAALDRFAGDREFMLEMFRQFRDQLPRHVEEIRSAMQSGDANHLVRLAHNLKGVSRNLSAEGLAAITIHIEEGCKREDLTDAPELVARLELEARRLEEYLSTRL